MPPLVNPFPLAFVAATTLGVLMHDTQVDRASAVALNPVYYSNVAAADAVSKSGDHVHVERMSMSHRGHSIAKDTLPKLQPRDDDRRYVQAKKLALSGGEGVSLWPST